MPTKLRILATRKSADWGEDWQRGCDPIHEVGDCAPAPDGSSVIFGFSTWHGNGGYHSFYLSAAQAEDLGKKLIEASQKTSKVSK